MKLKRIEITICQGCLDGDGQECHTPGCALWLHSVDLPIAPEFYEVKQEWDEADYAREPVALSSSAGGSR